MGRLLTLLNPFGAFSDSRSARHAARLGVIGLMVIAGYNLLIAWTLHEIDESRTGWRSVVVNWIVGKSIDVVTGIGLDLGSTVYQSIWAALALLAGAGLWWRQPRWISAITTLLCLCWIVLDLVALMGIENIPPQPVTARAIVEIVGTILVAIIMQASWRGADWLRRSKRQRA